MKTHFLLIVLMLFVITGFSQSKFTKITGPHKNLVVEKKPIHPDVYNPVFGGVPGAKLYDYTTIAHTWNDAQTINYGNIMQRNWAYPDGTLGSTFLSEGQNQDPDRGAGYVYFDGDEWGDPNLHVGPDDRMGSPCYAPWGPEGEIIAQYRYILEEGPIYLYKREIKGEGDWVEVMIPPPAGCSIVWHAMMTSGENNEHIHLLADTYDTPYNGQENALLYYRSSDGGETWDIFEETIEGLGPDYYPTINHLSYTWANPVGNTIAFTYGFDEWDGKVFKSYDNGDTWEYITVYNTEYDPFDPPTDSPDFGAGIGSSAIVLDSDAKAHVIFSRMVHVFVEGAANYYPYTDGMIYWNEDMDELDTATISATTLEHLEESGNLIGWVLGDESYVVPADQPTYANALCAFPVMSIDAENNLFAAWCAVAPGYSNGLVDYRHIVVNASYNGGNLWAGPEDLNTEVIFLFSECVFPMLAPYMYEHLQLTYQEDNEPGTFGWPSQQAVQTENKIQHMMIEKDMFVDVADRTSIAGFTVSDFYPNPATTSARVEITLKRPSDVRVTVSNIMGQRVESFESLEMAAGTNIFSLDVSGLVPGIYQCTFEADGNTVTRPVIIQK